MQEEEEETDKEELHLDIQKMERRSEKCKVVNDKTHDAEDMNFNVIDEVIKRIV